MLKHLPIVSLSAFAVVAVIMVGCTPPTPTPAPAPPEKPYASTQTADVVAELEKQKFTRGELDQLLYESYGLRMLFDLMELRLAKNTLEARGLTITPADFRAEREHIITGLHGDDSPPEDDPKQTPAANAARQQQYAAEGENLFNQFLQQQHVSKAEFDVKVIQTDAYLRKIVSALVVGKLPENTVRQGFEQLYGAKRRIADIVLVNSREAAIARLQLKNQAFAEVAKAMSVDKETAPLGGIWENPFTTQSNWVPLVIRNAAFAMNKGDISDMIVTDDGKYHIITVLEKIQPDPKLVNYEQVKDSVRKQMEDKLVETGLKSLREELAIKAQQEIVFDEPTLKAQWEALLDEQKGKNRDRDSARDALNAQAAKAATQTSTAPTTAP